jgi:formylmethanofuran dehydrogenase subunit C
VTPLILTLRRRPSTWLDLSSLTPDRLAGMNAASVSALPLRHGRERVTVGTLFDVAGKNGEHIRIRRSTDRIVRIGADMTRGSIEVRGHAGHYLGQGMSGGRIDVRGDAGDWLAAAMTGGCIEVSGDAGDCVGAAPPGETHGMSGGWVSIAGDAGAHAGDRMRRGTILVFGNAGEYAGCDMIAGTIMIMGRSGRGLGHGMRRGTIVLGRKPALVLSTFNSCGSLKMEFLRLLFKQTAAHGGRCSIFRNFGPEVLRYAGDAAAGGQGELLVLLNAGGGGTK